MPTPTAEVAAAGAGGAPSWLRVRFAKVGKVRFISHRDLARAWERSVRRIGLPVAWSKGFSPRPLLSFGLALPTGAESVAEYLDARLEGRVDASQLAEHLNSTLPRGLVALAVAMRAHGAGSLCQEVTSCRWELEVDGVSGEELATRVERFRGSVAAVVTRQRGGVLAREDIRPLIRELRLGGPRTTDRSSGHLVVDVRTQPRGVRPAEMAAALGTDLALARSRRTHQWIERDGQRFEPLPLDGTTTRDGVAGERGQERAS